MHCAFGSSLLVSRFALTGEGALCNHVAERFTQVRILHAIEVSTPFGIQRSLTGDWAPVLQVIEYQYNNAQYAT